MNKSLLISGIILLPCALLGWLQNGGLQNGAELRLRASTRMLEVDVTVRDDHGEPVDTLDKEDFRILDNGNPRPFSVFHLNRPPSGGNGIIPEPAPPANPGWPKLPPNVFTNIGPPSRPADGHSTVILLDGINGWFDNFAYARQGVIGMLGKVPADEKIALYAIAKNQGMVILQDYTLDRARLLDAIAKYVPRSMCAAPPLQQEHGEGMIDPIVALSPPPPSPHSGETDSAEESRSARMAALKRVTGAPPCITPGPKGMDLMEAGAEAVRLSLSTLADKLSHQPGRKSVFWMSQGFPVPLLRGEFEPAWKNTIVALNDANVAVNAVDSNGLDGPMRMWGAGEILAMKRLAQDTGGQAYYGRNDLDTAVASGIAESRSSYTLGFYLTEVDGKYHSLKVSVGQPGMTLGYRQGYFALDEPKIDEGQKTSDLSAALLSPANSTAVGIVANLDLIPGKPRASLKVRLKLDPDSLSVQASPAGLTGKVEEMFVEFNKAGREVGRVAAVSPFDIKPENRAAFENDGVAMVQTVPLSADAVKLSIVVRDTASGRIGSLTLPLTK